MENSSALRLLAVTNNERGDLFTRLVKDVFFALGYDNLHYDIHRSGREVDIQGQHRTESRAVVAECKAHAAKMGGEDINKFLGALTRERHKNTPNHVEGYFLSLSGFTETAIEQEKEMGKERIILLDAKSILDELEKCRAIVSCMTATERAGQCTQHAELRGATLDGVELLGHQRGYIWAIYYSSGKERAHVALIHADGTPLAESIAKEVIESDHRCGGSLHSLSYLPPAPLSSDRIALEERATANYRRWLAEECGYIQLDGLPADTDLSATRLRLERLFVPLRATLLRDDDEAISGLVERVAKEKEKKSNAISIGEIIRRNKHVALLAGPGGGKSTLLKRIASAYAFPERRDEVLDDLPQRQWLPLILRCRELRDCAHRPIIELLNDSARHAGMTSSEGMAFNEMMHAALRTGRSLLLVDGLDEISEQGARQTFANHLRTFVAMFPEVALIVTSREAGFRQVAGVIASACELAKLAPLDERDVLTLCERWNVQVIGDTAKVRAEAVTLGRAIWAEERIRALAENPLLLTTLLVVRRYIGELPRNRAMLYREAIRVLVRTWNVEGYAPLEEDETPAQLSYVACSMLEAEEQQISRKRLLELLRQAHEELEAELQFARISPSEFVERIEYRSSLLMQSGHRLIDGTLEPVYEFRHLTFQEYLAARGYVEAQYPGRNTPQDLADIFESHFSSDRWNEVISLGAVLAGSKAEEVIKRLVQGNKRSNYHRHNYILRCCILDEVKVTGATLRSALDRLARDEEMIEEIARGKFGEIFQQVAELGYLSGRQGFERYREAVCRISVLKVFGAYPVSMSEATAEALLSQLRGGDRVVRTRAAFVVEAIAYAMEKVHEDKRALESEIESIYWALCKLLDTSDFPVAMAASWAIAWIATRRVLPGIPSPATILTLFGLWRQATSDAQRHFISWALGAHPLLPRDTFDKQVWGKCTGFLRNALKGQEGYTATTVIAALVVGWYRGSPWTDSELADHLSYLSFEREDNQIIDELLRNLGDSGQAVLEQWKRQKDEYPKKDLI